MCSPIPNYNKLEKQIFLDLSPHPVHSKGLDIEIDPVYEVTTTKMYNPEERLRELLKREDIWVFDLQYCLNRLNKIYGFSY